jgi:hypothetical protein
LDDQRPDKSPQKDQFGAECVLSVRDIIGNSDTSVWKRVFPGTLKEHIFKNTILCSFLPIKIIAEDFLQTEFTIQTIKRYLWEGYEKLFERYNRQIIMILFSQGKQELLEPVINGHAELDTIIYGESYFITDLDIWILSIELNLPIVLFSSTKLKNMVNDINWLHLGGNIHDKLYFIRSPAILPESGIPDYHLILPSILYNDLKLEMSSIFQNAADLMKTSSPTDIDFPNIININVFLERFTELKRVKIVKPTKVVKRVKIVKPVKPV